MIAENNRIAPVYWLALLLAVSGGLCAPSIARAEGPWGWDGAQDGNGTTENHVLFYVAPMASLVIPDGGRDNNIGYGGTLDFGFRSSRVMAFEASVQYNQMKNQSPASGSTRLLGFGANALAFPFDNNLYFLGGVAYERTHHSPGDSSNYGGVLISLGAGYVFGYYHLFGIPFSIRTEGLYRLDAHNANRSGDSIGNGRRAFSDGVLNVGLIFPLGVQAHGNPKPASPPPVQVVPEAASP